MITTAAAARSRIRRVDPPLMWLDTPGPADRFCTRLIQLHYPAHWRHLDVERSAEIGPVLPGLVAVRPAIERLLPQEHVAGPRMAPHPV
jgi:hypothetical protein